MRSILTVQVSLKLIRSTTKLNYYIPGACTVATNMSIIEINTGLTIIGPEKPNEATELE